MKHTVLFLVVYAMIATNAYPQEAEKDDTAPNYRKSVRLLSDKGGDDKYPELLIGGRLQIQYRNIEGDNGSAGENRIFIRRVRFTLIANISDSGYLVVTPAAAGGLFSLQDTHLGFITHAGTIRIGNHYFPFSREALTTSKKYQFVEGHLTSQMALFYQPGLSILRCFNDRKVEIILGAYNSMLNQSAIAGGKLVKNTIYHTEPAGNTGNRFLYAGRIAIHPLGHLKKGAENFSGETKYVVALGFYAPDNREETNTTGEALLDSNAAQFDIQLNKGRLSIASEFAQRNTVWQDLNGVSMTSRQTSLSVQGTYLVTQRLSFGLRGESMDYDADNVLAGGAGQEEDLWTTVGANYYFKQHAMKMQINYVFKDEKMPDGTIKPENNTLLFQTAFYF